MPFLMAVKGFFMVFEVIFPSKSLQCGKIVVSLHPQFSTRAFSSVGLEHLPYKQRVGGSNPSTPTRGVSCGLSGLQDFFIIAVR
jgi:hypothetical protein